MKSIRMNTIIHNPTSFFDIPEKYKNEHHRQRDGYCIKNWIGEACKKDSQRTNRSGLREYRWKLYFSYLRIYT